MDASTPGAGDAGALSAATADPASSRAPSPTSLPAPLNTHDLPMLLSGTENDEAAPPVASTSAVAGSATAPSGGLLPMSAPGSDTGEVGALSRAKRVRSAVKFSPSKGLKTTSRRAALAATQNIANTSKSAAAIAQEEQTIPNEDMCFSCSGRGHFLCCDGCPRSFHFSCIDPPLELDEIPISAWYCNVCASSRKMPLQPKGIFGPLILKVQCDNPTIFELPKEIKASFKGITTGSYSEFVDTDEFRPLSQLGKPGKNGYEERDPYKIRDKQNRTVLCARCHEPASPAKQKKILACDFCELHWHLDCVDPPLVGLPAITRRWKCPIHADSAAPSRKALKNPKIVKINKQRTQNNGDIDIIPSKRATTANSYLPEELISQGIRYQVPEQIVILDFWSRVKRDKYGMPFERINRDTTPVHNLFDFSDSSSLTSMEASPERDLGPAVSMASAAAAKGKGRAEPNAEAPSSAPLQREDSAMSDGDPPDIEGWKAHMLHAPPPEAEAGQNGHLEVEGQAGMQVDQPEESAAEGNGAISPDTRGAEQLFALYTKHKAPSPAPSEAVVDGTADNQTPPIADVKQEVVSRAPSPAAASANIAAADTSGPPSSGRSLRVRSRSPLPSASARGSSPIAAAATTAKALDKAALPASRPAGSSAAKPPVLPGNIASKDAATGPVGKTATAGPPPQITHTASSPIAAKHPPSTAPTASAAMVKAGSSGTKNGITNGNGASFGHNASRVDKDGDTSMS